MAKDWPFSDPPNTSAFTCRHVWEQTAPILYVSHDEDGDWQFLCGGQHGDETGEKPVLVCLQHVVERDPTIAELAELCTLHQAERDGVGAKWRIHDRGEDLIHQHIAEYGWHVVLIEAENEEPAFAYSIGLYHSFRHPEIIAFGLKRDTLHSLINVCGDRIKDGETLPLDEPVDDVLADYPCIFKLVPREHYREHVGYARWFYKGDEFPLIQLVWPDRDRRFPWQDGVEDGFRRCQPVLAAPQLLK